MRVKKWICALMAFLSVLLCGIAVACEKTVSEGPESGVYYYDTGAQEYLVVLSAGTKFDFYLEDEHLTGTYELAEGALTVTLGDEEKTQLSATLSDDVLKLVYNEAEMRFLRRVNYTVSFESNGGSPVADSSVLNGKTVAKPADPVRDGYKFVGWFTDEAFTEPYLFGTETVTSNITLYAQWGSTVAGLSEYTIDFDLNYDGAEALGSITTIGGIIYDVDVPVPTREGYTFQGWWVSMYDDASKLSYAYTAGMEVRESLTMYALWTENAASAKLAAPIVTIEGDTVRWNAVSGVSSYAVEVTGPEGFTAIDTATGSTTISVPFSTSPAGDYEIRVTAVAPAAVNDSDTTLRCYRNKALDKVSQFTVNEPAVLLFNGVANAERYLITIECGNEAHTHTLFDNGTSTNYNFANCSMKAGGIRFTVTAVAEGYASSQSRVFVYNRLLSEVSGFYLDEETGTLVWDAVENATSYVVSVRAGIETVTEDIGNKTSYSLKGFAPAEGGIFVNVYPKAKGYNSPEPSEFHYNKTALATPSSVKLVGTTLSWGAVEGATGYEVAIGSTVLPSVTETTLDLAEAVEWISAADYEITIRALGTENSLWSDPIDIRYYAMYAALSYSASTVSWRYAVGAQYYEVSVNGELVATIRDGSNSAEITLTRAGTNTISVRFSDGENYSETATIEVYAHTMTFDSRGGAVVGDQFKAVGDKVTLPEPEKLGYDFKGWYNTPYGAESNGLLYDDETYSESGEIVLYAYYTPKAYTITYDYAGTGTGPSTATVYYERSYQLDVPTNTDPTKSFGGWYSIRDGRGTQYTNENGSSVGVWTIAGDATVVAYWQDLVLEYDYVTVDGITGYVVSKGDSINLVSEVTIPQEYRGVPVIMIAGYGFRNCTTLRTINMYDTIRLISSTDPFSGCSNLEAINVTPVEGNNIARYWSEDGVLFDDGDPDERPEDPTLSITTLLYMPLAKTGVYRIPNKVTTIGMQAFAGRAITGVIIPTSVTTIDEQAFYNCEELATVSFDKLTEGETAKPLTIGKKAFANCEALTSITLPARLTSIPIKKYYITGPSGSPESYTVGYTATNTMMENAFAGCTALEYIDVEAGNANYSSKDGLLCDAAGTTILFCPEAYTGADGEFTIPAGITAIGDGAFLRSSMTNTTTTKTTFTSVIIPSTVTSIGEAAFYYCLGLTKVTFGGNGFAAVTIGRYAFRSCSYLTEVVFEDGSQVTTIGDGAFYSCTRLASITIPASMSSVEQQAFRACTGLVSATIAPSEKELAFGEDVFYGCTKLTEFYIPANVSKLPGVFGGCTALQNVYVDENSPYFKDVDGVLFSADMTELIFFAQGRGGSYEIPYGVTTIANGVFRNNDLITEIIIPATVSVIGSEAFRDCELLSSIVFSTEVPTAEEGTAVAAPAEDLVIGERAFYNLDELLSFALPARTSVLGYYALYGCNNLTSLTLNEGLVLIGEYAIYSCSSLETLTIPSTVKKIDNYGVYNNRALAEIIFAPNSQLETIGNYGLACNVYASIVIPKSVKTIGRYALYDSSYSSTTTSTAAALTSVTFEEGSQLEVIGAYAFYYRTGLKTITIPKSVKEIQPYAFAYSGLTEVLFEEGGTEDLTIGAYMTYRMSATSTVDSVLYGYAFYYSDLTGVVNLPARTTLLGQYAFAYTDITGITFAGEGETSRLQNIGARAFYSCGFLESITIPKTVQNLAMVGTYNRFGIGEYAFYNCRSLNSVVFEEGGTGPLTLGNYAFNNCSSLTSLTLPARMGSYQGAVTTTQIGFYSPLAGDYVFSGCSSLAEVNVGAVAEGEDGGELASLDGILYSSDFATLIYCPMAKTGTVTIPASVTEIAARAFYNCDGITGIVFSGTETDGEMTIKENAFYDCDGITEIVLSDNVTRVEANAFANCSALESITFPASLTSFDATMISGCDALQSLVVKEGSEVYKTIDGVLYSADGKILYYYLPSRTATSYTVAEGTEAIAERAFYGNEYLESVTLPQGLVTIEASAFAYCDALRSISIPNTVTTIGQAAFYYSTALETVTFEEGGTANLTIESSTSTSGGAFGRTAALKELVFPSRLVELGVYNFYYSGVKYIYVPATLKTVGNYAFAYAREATKIEFEEGNKALTKLGTYTFYYCLSLTELVNLPDSIKTIGASTFRYCYDLASIDLPSSLTSIPNYTFAYCYSLESIEIPASVTSFAAASSASYAPFYRCDVLKTITFEEGSKISTLANRAISGATALESIELPNTITTFGTYTFENCKSLKTITLPDKLKTMGNYTFSGCDLLESVVIPDSVTSIGTYTFYNCDSLTSVKLPENNSIKATSNYMFYNCISLTNVTIPSTYTGFGQYTFRNTAITEFTVPSQITSLPVGLFYGCESLTKVTIHDKVTAIGGTSATSANYVFRDCTALEEIVIPDSATITGTYTFEGCTSLRKVTLPSNSAYTAIGNYTFNDCESLAELTIPDQITSIGNYALSNTALTSVTLSDKITSVGTNAFQDSLLLESVTLPANEKFVTLSNYLFDGCVALKSVNIPETVTSIGNYVFRGCAALTEVTVPNSVNSIGTNAFQNCAALTKATLPANENFTTISANLFDGCSSLAAVNIPSSVTKIGRYAFADCAALTEITIPEGVKTIYDNAFTNTTNLADVTFPSTLEEMGNNAFYASGIKEVSLSAGIETISAQVFGMCTQLTEVLLPSTVTSIDDLAFMGCSSLVSIEIPAFVTTIGINPFAGCTSLASISIDSLNTAFYSRDGILYNGDTNALIVFPSGKTGSFTVPEGAILSDGAFAGSIVEEITISDGVTLGISMFDSSYVKKINLPASMTEIPAYFYAGTLGLTSVTLPATITTIGDSAFLASSVTEVILPEGLTTIGGYAFSESAIETFNIPSTLTRIEDYAFSSAEKLKAITFTAGGTEVLTIGIRAFEKCTALETVAIPARVRAIGYKEHPSLSGAYVYAINNYCFVDCTALRTVTFEDEATSNFESEYNLYFGTYVFSGCSALESIAFPSYLGKITYTYYSGGTLYTGTQQNPVNNYMFYECTSLTSVTFNYPEEYTEDDQINFFGTYVFRGCTALKSFEIPNRAKYVNSSMFRESGIESIVIPESVTYSSIGTYSFMNCLSLKSVVIRAQSTTIGSYAFDGCTALESVVFETDTITTFNSYAFRGCTALKTITIPASVQTIATNAFDGWTSEQTIRLEGVASEAELPSGFNANWLGEGTPKIEYLG